jgi:hypothetical protein
MNALTGERFDHLLPELPQANAAPSQLGMLAHHTEKIALCRIGVHPDEKIRRREIEKAQRVRLNQLRQIQDAPQFPGRGLCSARRRSL